MFSAPDVFLKAKIKLNILGAVLFAFKIGYLANIYFGMQLKEIIFLGIYFLQQAMAVCSLKKHAQVLRNREEYRGAPALNLLLYINAEGECFMAFRILP